MDDEISSEELAALLGDAAPPAVVQEAKSATSKTPASEAASERLDEEISADELAALGFAQSPAPAPSPAPSPQPAPTATSSPPSGPTPPEKGAGAAPRLPELTAQDDVAPDAGIGLLMDVPLRVSIELGRISMTLQQVLGLGRGSIIELERLAGEPVDILVNDKLIGRGEVVVIDEYFGVKITELIDPKG
jgi:flagellar motor switch protein FliN/FliY